jgi:hypothetical protein
VRLQSQELTKRVLRSVSPSCPYAAASAAWV